MRLALLAGLLLWPSAARAGLLSSSERGTTSANFLKLGPGARALAMGEAYSAVADDATALYWNPAGLTLIPARQFSAAFMHAAYVASSFYDYGAYARNLGPAGAWGVGLQYFSAGSVAGTDETGAETGNFTPHDLAATLGYAREFRGFSIGIAGKYISSRIAGSARTGAADFGVLTPAYLDGRLRLALAASNIGGRLRFDEVSEDLPRQMRLGAAYRLSPRWLAAADLILPADNNPAAAFGVERRWALGSQTSFAARAGFNSRTLRDIDGLNALSLGLGLASGGLALDYAFLPLGSLGTTHRVSMSLRFDPGELARKFERAPKPKLKCEEFHGVTICDDPRDAVRLYYVPGNPPPRD